MTSRHSSPTAAAIVIDGDKVLLVRRNIEPWKDAWDIPGGFCEFAEHPEVTAVREVFEETGYDIALEAVAGIWMSEYGDLDISCMNVYYYARPTGQTGSPDPNETAEVAWFSTSDLPTNIAFPELNLRALALFKESLPKV